MNVLSILIFLSLLLNVVSAGYGEHLPIPRKDAFFGMHFDLHPQKGDTSLGADITEEMIDRLLTRAKPDYVQYDCKGHAGYTGYPTQIGWPSPGIVKDSLAIWRAATQKHGVGLYIHYSGVWDSVAIEHHPEWARIDAEGKSDPNSTSVFSSYVDELLIPQLKEVTSAYQLDGLWVDGECWAAKLDYSPAAIKAWQEETGYTDAPKERSDPRWLEWKMFHRRHYEKYLCHWVDALHESNPKLQITSNWMYTTLAPLPITAKLDYLSGDYSPGLSVDRARVEARYLASTGMPWDLMAWGFNKGENLGWSLKTPIHLQQEASAVLMQGGGFQFYNTPTRSGYIIDSIIETAGQVAEFCRARQKVSHKSTSIPQVALLLSAETQLDRSENVFSPWGTMDELEGALHALLELHYSVDILAEHQLQPRINEFPLVVIPDSYKLQDEFKDALLNYVDQGGSLLLLGEKCARLFQPALGVQFDGDPSDGRAEIESRIGIANANGSWQKVTPTTATPAGFRFPTRDTRSGGEVAATITSYGKGKIGAVYGPLAIVYFRSHHPYLRQFIGDIVTQLFPVPMVEIEGPPCVDVALRHTQDGRLSVHLLNLANVPLSNRHPVIDFIPSVGPIDVRLRLPKKPKKISWIPEEGRLKKSWKDGILTVTIPSLHVHGVLVLE
ncbi:MAG: alpha-amylase family protein [bacterium]